MESSRRDLLNDMAEHRRILQSNKNTYLHRFGFIPKTGVAFPKTGFCFYCDLAITQTNQFANIEVYILMNPNKNKIFYFCEKLLFWKALQISLIYSSLRGGNLLRGNR